MSTAFDEYLDRLEELRRLREAGCSVEAEEPLMERLDVLWRDLAPEQQEQARAFAWIAVPAEYQRRLSAEGGLGRETSIETTPFESPPRVLDRAA